MACVDALTEGAGPRDAPGGAACDGAPALAVTPGTAGRAGRVGDADTAGRVAVGEAVAGAGAVADDCGCGSGPPHAARRATSATT
jgi:hypothetical protein